MWFHSKQRRRAATIATVVVLISAVFAIVRPDRGQENAPPVAQSPGGSTAEKATTTIVQPVDRNSVVQTLTQVVNAYAEKSTATDPTFYTNGQWRNGQEAACWRCTLGPGVAAALIARTSGDSQMRNRAIETFETMVTQHQTGEGAFMPANPQEDGLAITTMFAATELGTAYVELRDQLPADQKKRWAQSIARSADYLVAKGNLRWYTNGNIVIGNALVMQFAWLATGDQRYRDAYENALEFAVAPPADRWPGYGLVYTKQPAKADGSDGAAYLAEAGKGGPGYDPEYTSLQLDQLTRLYLVSGDARVVRLMNLLTNQLLPKVDLATGKLDTSNGTRHTEADRTVGFNSPAVGVLAQQGGRTDLKDQAIALWSRQAESFRDAANYVNYTMYYSLGAQPASLLMVSSKDG